MEIVAQVETPGAARARPLLGGFSFPLNFYARLLEQSDAKADYLHYGLFNSPQQRIGEAQERSTQLLLRNLPPPCHLLDVGIGLGTTLARLHRCGYSITGITPEAAQIAYARARHGSDLSLICSRLEDFVHGPGTWDALLFQESAQYVNPVDIFAAADRLLGAQGEIIVLDEFALRRGEAQRENLHLLEHFLRLGERCGFSVETQIDLSSEAAPTLDWALAALHSHQGELGKELGLSAETLAALATSNRAYRLAYAEGRYGYFLLRLKRQAQASPWRIGWVDAERAAAMRALFHEVFEHEQSAAHWQWKYGEGRGTGIGVWNRSDDKMVAHYGGVTRDILYFGAARQAVQCGDVMVASGGRRTLSRKAPVFLAAATFMEQQLGFGTAHLIGFGFPNERAYRLPEKLGLYDEVGRMQELTWPALHGGASLCWKVRELPAPTAAALALIDGCWQAMSASLSTHIVGVRDGKYVAQRYFAHPDKRYRTFWVGNRLTGQTVGLFILRHEPNGSCELLDVIAARARVALLLRQARRVAATLGCAQLFAWVVDSCVADFAADADIKDLNVPVPGNHWTAGPSHADIAGHWWLTGGDADFR